MGQYCKRYAYGGEISSSVPKQKNVRRETQEYQPSIVACKDKEGAIIAGKDKAIHRWRRPAVKL